MFSPSKRGRSSSIRREIFCRARPPGTSQAVPCQAVRGKSRAPPLWPPAAIPQRSKKEGGSPPFRRPVHSAVNLPAPPADMRENSSCPANRPWASSIVPVQVSPSFCASTATAIYFAVDRVSQMDKFPASCPCFPDRRRPPDRLSPRRRRLPKRQPRLLPEARLPLCGVRASCPWLPPLKFCFDLFQAAAPETSAGSARSPQKACGNAGLSTLSSGYGKIKFHSTADSRLATLRSMRESISLCI